jgi:hypothetical protein
LSSTTSGSPGDQTRRNATIAATASSEPMMSVSSTEMKFELTNWPTANVTPATIAAGQTARTPRMPSTMPTRISGTNSARIGV